MDVKQDDSDVQQNLKMKGHKDSSMQPQSKMVVQEEDSTVQTKPKMEVQDDVQPTEKSNVQPKSKIGGSRRFKYATGIKSGISRRIN